MPDLSGSGLSGKQLANPEMFRPSSADLLGNHSSEPENIMTIPITKGKVLKFISNKSLFSRGALPMLTLQDII